MSRLAKQVLIFVLVSLALAVYYGKYKMTYGRGHFGLFRIGPDIKVADVLDMADEPVMSEYLEDLIESFQQIAVDLSAGEVSAEDLEQLRSLGYTQ